MLNRFSLSSVPALAALLVAGTALHAQVSTGTLMGSVKDKAGKPVAGAKVVITSPAIFQPRQLTTNANGEWVAPLLPPGSYRIVVAKEGWVGSEASNLRVGIGTSFRQDLSIRPVQETKGATVEVVASSAEVDKTDTKVGSNYSADDLAVLPSSGRGFSGAADLAPGLVASAGSYSIRGGVSSNTRYTVNGSDVKDDYQGQLTGTYYIEDNVEDVQVILSPLNARNGRSLGGSLNVVTKTGSNEFHGSVRGQVLRNGWYSIDRDFRQQDEGQVEDALRREYQVTLNGPLVKDRLWFAFATRLQPNQTDEYQITDAYHPLSNGPVRTGIASVDGVLATGPAGSSLTRFDVGAYYKRVSEENFYEGKLSGSIIQDHVFEVAYSYSKSNLAPRNPFGDGGSYVSRVAALGTQKEEKKVLGLAYRGLLSASTVIEAKYNKVDSEAIFPWGDPNYGTGEGMIVYQGRGNVKGARGGLSVPFGFGITPTPDARNNRSGNLNVQLFREFLHSNHQMDFGFDYYESLRGTSSASGARNLYFRVGGIYAQGSSYLFPVLNGMGAGVNGQDGSGTRGPAPSVMQYFGADGFTKNRMEALYFNDQITINEHWGLMVGLRYDMLKVIDTNGEQLGDTKDFSPRLQVNYDVNGDSRHLIKFTAARFNGDFSTAFTDAFIKKANTTYVTRQWAGNPYNPGDASDPTGLFGVRFVDYKTVTDIANYGTPIDFGDTSKTYWVDKKMKAPYMDELSIGYTRQWENGSKFSATYVYRQWKDDWAFFQDYNNDNMQTVTDPSGTLPDTYRVQATRVANTDVLVRKFNSLELEWKMPINSRWTLGGNWTYARLVGNNNGGQATGGSSFRDNSPSGRTYNYDYLTKVVGLTDNDFAPYGPLTTDVPHRGRLYLSGVLPLGKGNVSYAWMLNYQSGGNYDLSTNAPIEPAFPDLGADVFTFAPTTYTQFYNGRGQFRTNDTWAVDFKINFNVPLNIWKVMFMGELKVNNLFNQSMEYGRNHSFYAGSTGDPRKALFLDNLGTRFGKTPNDQPGDNYWGGGRYFSASLGFRF